jgi:hypothetical protein
VGVGVLVVSLPLGYSHAPTDANLELGCTGSADPYDLLAEVLAVQEPQKRFRHTFDPLKYILFETIFSRKLPFGKASERLGANSTSIHRPSSVVMRGHSSGVTTEVLISHPATQRAAGIATLRLWNRKVGRVD